MGRECLRRFRWFRCRLKEEFRYLPRSLRPRVHSPLRVPRSAFLDQPAEFPRLLRLLAECFLQREVWFQPVRVLVAWGAKIGTASRQVAVRSYSLAESARAAAVFQQLRSFQSASGLKPGVRVSSYRDSTTLKRAPLARGSPPIDHKCTCFDYNICSIWGHFSVPNLRNSTTS